MDQAVTPERERALREQASASDPGVSAFVAASAGSGKTKLLTDRMLRLMLGGAEPARIQCLTFTKAAAAEMALRLQHRLGRWVTLDDAALDAELRGLLVAPTGMVRDAARGLFAEVLDLPGGMRIGTIHAFCQGLLRRFPLEAAISPHFQLVEGPEAEAEMRAAREDVLAVADAGAVAVVASLERANVFGELVHALQAQRARLGPLLDLPEAARERRVRAAAGARHGSEAEAIADGVRWGEEQAVHDALWKVQADGSSDVRLRALRMLGWLSMSPEQRALQWDDWLHEFIDGNRKPRAWGRFPNTNLNKEQPWIRTAIEAEQARVLAVEDARRAVRCAAATTALLRLAAPALDAYAATKQRAGLLDYSDLIGRAERLLEDPGAAWVLYKLDGGIDHLLLDEVQDTAPEQWRIAHRLTEEFYAGLGARGAQDEMGRAGAKRTFFAVGDPKQSIYSFQGADPTEFQRSREAMSRRVGASGQVWRDVTLDVSFRSTAPVLALVDAVFADPVAGAGVADGGDLRHYPDRAGVAGQVELWPLAPPPAETDAKAWTVPAENQGLVSAQQLLADAIAGAVGGMLAQNERLEGRDRPLDAGDILILVRRRGPFATALVRALKARGVAVAGLDRLLLTEQIAVQDLLAACDAVLLPEDDLAVACVLTSPLGGLSDTSLMDLALGRTGRLWDALRDRAGDRADWAAAWRFLSALAARADFVSPHALLVEALGPLGGRARLLARLGAEAAEPVDELLGQALAYTRVHAPSLQGFVQWLRRSGAEVKREAGGAGSVVRIMTAHGAKGLQAPLVILPDTTGLPPEPRDGMAWTEADGLAVPLWAPRSELRCPAWKAAADAAKVLRMREYNRLLYVALTRAEDRLIVCGWAPKRTGLPDESWYAMVRRGFERMNAAPESFPWAPGAPTGASPGVSWPGEMLVASTRQTAPVPAPRPPAVLVPASLPVWAGRPGDWTTTPPPEEPLLPRPLAPSRPDGARYGSVPAAASPLAGGATFMRGRAVHELLQHLPALPGAARAAAGAGWLARTALDAAARMAVLDQVLAVLDHPDLAALFGTASRAEQPLSGLVGGQVVSGVVDRIAVLPGAVLIADFKTGRAAPERVADTPVRYVRQLSAYRAVARGLFPGRPVLCWLVWTEGARAVAVPEALLDRHAPGVNLPHTAETDA